MATQTKEPPKKEVAKTNGSETANALVLAGKQVSIEDAANALNEATVGEKDSSYLELEPGDETRVVFLGWEKIQGMGDKSGTEVPAASFVTKSGKKQINADAVIVSYFQKQQTGIARRIVCTGTVKSKNGFDYKTFDFYELNLKK